VIYACQDVEADRRLGLHSIPVRLGIPAALRIAALLHVLCVALFALVAWLADLTPAYPAALAVAAILLWRAHRLAEPGDVTRGNVALMPINGFVAVLLGAAGIFDALV
jgi:4-hydroxybenzoate polyprenyltransferase